jgi:hypothetical protein
MALAGWQAHKICSFSRVQIHNSLDWALPRLSLECSNNSTTRPWGIVMRIESKVSKIIYVSCLTIFLTGLGSWVVLAHQDAPAQPKADMADAHFAKAAAQGGMAEIQLGPLSKPILCYPPRSVRKISKSTTAWPD